MNTLPYIDFHAHHPSLAGEWVIQDGVQTRGRHPWYLSADETRKDEDSYGYEEQPEGLLAIGESGLDKLCDTPYDLQLQVFKEEVSKSERFRLPLYLHCVRAIDDVLCIRRALKACQPVIWHGYTGNDRQIGQLLSPRTERECGAFYFSFGFRHKEDALRACPLSRLLLETDNDTAQPVSLLYERVAAVLNLSLYTLVRQMHENYRALFG